MKFEEAFDKAYQKTPPECRPKGNENFPKLLALMWSILKESQNVLDDTVYIANNNIVSILDTKEKKGQTPKTSKKASKKAATTKKDKESDKDITGNGKEEKEKTTTEPAEE